MTITASPRVDIRVLGPFVARHPGRGEIVFPRKAQVLFARLGTSPREGVSRDTLAALLWGEHDDEHARHSLRQTLHLARLALGPEARGAIVLACDRVALDPEIVAVDALSFTALTSDRSPESLSAAIALYRGDLLAGLALDEPSFEEWLRAERDRLREQLFDALARVLAHQQHAGDVDGAIRTAMRLLALDPLQEPVHRCLMRLYLRQDRRASALRQYRTCVDHLARELGVAPEPETQALYASLAGGLATVVA